MPAPRRSRRRTAPAAPSLSTPACGNGWPTQPAGSPSADAVTATAPPARCCGPPWARLIYPGDRSRHIFAGAAGQRRRDLVTAAVAAGRVHLADGEADPALGRLDCAGFVIVTCADGTTGPWLKRLGPGPLDHELRMLRAATYIFTAALSMMRDSEIQEIQRGAVTTHYGSPAVTSRKTKLDPARLQLRWWITEPVAQAVAVAERLNRHPPTSSPP